jgi:DNA-binding transcriptional LysR family regulator
MDRLEAMKVLVATVEEGSFSAASRKLGMPLPSVSRKVADLEAHLKTRLLLRSTRKLSLTEAGSAYVAASRRILAEIAEAERAATGEYSAPRGDLVVTAPIVFGRLHVLPIVTGFLETFAAIDVRMVLSDRNIHLIDDGLDLAVRIGALPDSSLVASTVGFVRRVVCASPDFLARHGTPQSPEALTALPCVSFDTLSAAGAWDFTPSPRHPPHTVPIHARFSVNTAEAALDAAIAGVGVTRVLSYQAAAAVAAGALKIVLCEFEPEPLPVHLLHVGQQPLPLKTRAFLDFVAPRLRERLSAVAAQIEAR